MTRKEITMEYLSKEVIGKIQDKTTENILRRIIFNSDINWILVDEVIRRYRPEVKL